ncbi:MAG TPA: hypothetical protein VKB56_14055 [Terriglobales bacterium]|nr:hypothetical protein [Terriglobales bacterium]
MTWRAIFAFVLVVMIAASIGMAFEAAERSPGWFLHPGAQVFLMEALLALVVYAGAIIVIVANRGEEWDVELRNAAIFGSITGIVELINVALESYAATSNTGLQLAGMLAIFALWGMAALSTARELRRFRSGVAAAVMSAGVCMVIAVTAGFALELFIAPLQPEYVATWPEFKRSGWLDAQAFAVANTLASGFTHLCFGPVIAVIVGCAGAGIGKRMAPQD